MLDVKERNEDFEKTVNMVLQKQLKRPFSRIFGYKLTLHEIVKSMAQDHPDKKGMDELINKFHEITVEIDGLIA